MREKSKSLLKNIGLFTIGSFGSKIVSFLMVPLYTALLSTSDYGTVDLISSTTQLLTPILLLSIQDATLRFSMDPDYEKEDVLSTSFNIILKGTAILTGGIIIVNYIGLFDLSPIYYLFLFLSFFWGSINNVLNLYLKAKNKASIIAISGIVCTLISCTSNVVLLLVCNMGILGYMISNTIGILVQVLYQMFIGKLYQDLHLRNYKNLSKPMISYSAPLIANSISWWVNNASDRYILTWMLGVAVNGVYSVAYKVPTILSTLQGIFYNAWSISAIAEFDEEDTDGFIGNNYTLYSFISIVGCSVLLLANILIAKFLYSGDFFYAWRFVPFLLVGTVFNGIAQFEGSLFAATRKTKEVAQTTVFGALLNTVCNFIFIYFLGAVGASLATMIGYAVMWLLRTIYLRKFITMKVNWKQHGISIVLLIIQALLSTINILYIVQWLLFVGIIVLHKKCVFQVIKTIKK